MAALHKAPYEILAEDSSCYGEIPGFEGVYANAESLESCREELREVARILRQRRIERDEWEKA